MENIIAEEELDDEDDAELEEKEDFSPSQPVLLSQKAGLLKDALQKNAQATKEGSSSCDIDDMLGDKSRDKKQAAPRLNPEERKAIRAQEEKYLSSQIRIVNNEEKISNSSTPIENEKLAF